MNAALTTLCSLQDDVKVQVSLYHSDTIVCGGLRYTFR
jgi:hypothetical protein